MAEEQADFSQLLKDLESPLEDVRLAALRGLETIPSLAILRAVRRVACTDPSVSLRFEARRFLSAASEKLPEAAKGSPKGSALERFQALLADPDPGIRVKVIRTLVGNLDPAVPKVLAGLLPAEKDPFVICALLQALSATGDQPTIRLIRPYLKDPEARIRAAAVEALEAIGDVSVLVRLMPLLQDPHHRVRAVVARAMRAQEREAVLACVDGMLASANEAEVRSALYVLRFFDEETALPRLQEKLGKPGEEMRNMTLASLLFLSRKGSVRAGQILARTRETPAAGIVIPLDEAQSSPIPIPLEERIDSPHSDIRVAAVLDAVRLGRDDMMPRVRSLVAAEEDPRVQATLVSAAGRLGAPVDVHLLTPFLKSDDPRLRANAVEAIGLLAPGRAAELLRPHLNDPGNRARANAIVALASGEVDVMGPLRQMAMSGNPAFAASAVWAASTIASAAAARLLGEMLTLDDPDTVMAARNALTALAPVMREAKEALENAVAPPAERPAVDLPESKIQRLLFDLRHDSAEVRLGTVRTIASLSDPRLLQEARRLLRDEDPTVRRAAREAVREMLRNARKGAGDAKRLVRFEEELRSGEERARAALEGVLDVALACGVTETARALGRRLPIEEHPFVRANLISSIALLGEPSEIQLIQAFVRDPDARVRANAVDALELAGSEQDLLAAVTCLLDSDPRVRAAAVRAAAAIDKEVFLAHLRSMLGSDTIAERAAGLYVARTMMIPERFDLLREHFAGETQPKLYETCADALARELSAGRSEELQRLMAELPEGNKKHYLQQAVLNISQPMSLADLQKEASPKDVSALAELSSPYSKMIDLQRMGELTGNAVREALARESDPLSISFLLETAADMKLPDVIELAQPFIKSRDRRIRLAAVEALGKLKSAEAIESIAALVRDRDAEVSRRALDQLQKLGPGAAQSGVRALLDSGQPWAVRRGLELLEQTGSAAAMPLVLGVLERGSNPGIVEPLSKLVLAWGDAATLDELSGLYQRASANSRPFLLELGTELGQRLGLGADAIAGKFPVDLAAAPPSPATAGPKAKVKPAPSRPKGEAIQLSQTQLAIAGGIFGVLALSSLVLLWPRTRTLTSLPSEPAPLAEKSGAGKGRIVFDSTAPATRQLSSDTTSFPPIDYSSMTSDPTLAEIEDRLKIALAPQGIQSAPIIHLLALDEVQGSYRGAIARARELVRAGKPDEAIRMLESALAQLDPEHLSGRLALILALEEACKKAGKYDKMHEWRAEMKNIEKKLYELCAQAARESGMSEEKVRAALVELDERDESKKQLLAASDFFSGVEEAGGAQ